MKVNELGVCPAAVDSESEGINNGKNAGKFCQAVTGTFCEGRVQGSFAEKLTTCMNCDFYRTVKGEESKDFVLTRE
ncbi:MAG: hypothetical protein DRP87_14605 [Spirochaetes bacterium]|nr:MAG: hypothetical protein DRP87_14605 [Spirochaetota bacterium]